MHPESDNNPEQSESPEGPDLHSSAFSYFPEGVDASIDHVQSNYLEHGNKIVDVLQRKFLNYMELLEATRVGSGDYVYNQVFEGLVRDLSTIYKRFEPGAELQSHKLSVSTLQRFVAEEDVCLGLVDANYGLRSIVLDLRRDPNDTLFAYYEEVSSPVYHLVVGGPTEEEPMEVVALFSEAALDEVVDNLYKVKTYLHSDQKMRAVDYTDIPVPSRVFSLCMNDILDFNDRRNTISSDTEFVVSDIRDVNFWKEDGQYKVHIQVEVTEQSTGNNGAQAGVSVGKSLEDHTLSVGLGRVGELVVMREKLNDGELNGW